MGYSEIKGDKLVFNFPEIGADCALEVGFVRTLRLPDDNKEYGLPPGLGSFELAHVDDHKKSLPASWARHGGAFLPMWQAEAMWLSFKAVGGWPFAIKIAAGKVNALTGEAWTEPLSEGGQKQDYMVAPKQPWIDGFCIAPGVVRQFVSMPQGAGYTAEEQITGKAEHGGLQIIAYPMASEARDRLAPRREKSFRGGGGGAAGMVYACSASGAPMAAKRALAAPAREMGLAAGGLMRQAIYEDPYAREGAEAWSQEGARCFVHLMDARDYQRIVGRAPRSAAPGPLEYQGHNLPWFDYYDPSGKELAGSSQLAGLDSVAALGVKLGEKPLPAPGSAPRGPTVKIGPSKGLDGSW